MKIECTVEELKELLKDKTQIAGTIRVQIQKLSDEITNTIYQTLAICDTHKESQELH